MIELKVIDFFQQEADAHIHQANCFHVMGAGIAKDIRELFPEAYEADKKTSYGDPSKLGTFSHAAVYNFSFPGVSNIINLYGQFELGGGKRQTDYNALVEGLTSLRNNILKKDSGEVKILAIPYGIGCNRGGGDWHIVMAILESVFGQSLNIKVLICQHPDFGTKGVLDSGANLR